MYYCIRQLEYSVMYIHTYFEVKPIINWNLINPLYIKLWIQLPIYILGCMSVLSGIFLLLTIIYVGEVNRSEVGY